MRIKFYFLFVILFANLSVFATNPPANSAINELDVFSGIVKDKDFWAYLKCKYLNTYPVVFNHADKFYVIARPGSALKEMPANSFIDQPVFTVTSFKIKENNKVRVKITFLNKKLLVTAEKLCCSKWAVRSLFAREAGGIKPELYSFK